MYNVKPLDTRKHWVYKEMDPSRSFKSGQSVSGAIIEEMQAIMLEHVVGKYVINEFSKIAANCFESVITLLLIAASFGVIVGGKNGMLVLNKAFTVMKTVFRVSVTTLIRLVRKVCLYAFALIRCICRYIYRLSRKNWMPWSRLREQQPDMRITRIQRLIARAQDNSQERPRDSRWE